MLTAAPLCGHALLVIEEPALARQSTAIADKLFIHADDAMTWNEDGERVGAVGTGGSANGPGFADGARDFGITARLSRRDGQKRIPHRDLKRRAESDQRCFESRQRTVEMAASSFSRRVVEAVRPGNTPALVRARKLLIWP